MLKNTSVALLALVVFGGCLHFEETFLVDGDGGVADATIAIADAGAPDADSSSLRITVDSNDLRLGINDSLAVDISVERLGDVAGAIDVSVTNLPSGVSVESLEIAAGDTTGVLQFAATGKATLGAAELTIAASIDEASGMVALPLFVAGATATFDITFNGGSTTLPLATTVQDLLLTDDGRLLVLANESGWNVIAYDEFGALDTSYGTSGRVALPSGVDPVAMAARPTGGIAIAVNRTSPVQAGVVALTEMGGLDVNFSSGTSFISTIKAGGGTTRVTDIVVAPSGTIYMSGNLIGGNDGAIYEFSPVGVFDDFQTNAGSDNFKNIRLQNDKLVVGGQKKGGGAPDYMLARFTLDLALDATFAVGGIFESGASDFAYSHFDVDTTGRIAAMRSNSNPSVTVDMLDADATGISQSFGSFATGSGGFSGEGAFGPDGDFVIIVNGCSNSCQIHDSEIALMLATEPADGTYERNLEMAFDIDDADQDTRWKLERVAVDSNSRIVVAGTNGGVVTLLRLWP
tara:strand:+ start:40296 stop:41849 length:1554 start_codon:yes stop_codon:yes gene_type:complete